MQKVIDLKTGSEAEYNESYAQRLVEQGKAVFVKEEKPASKPGKAGKK